MVRAILLLNETQCLWAPQGVPAELAVLLGRPSIRVSTAKQIAVKLIRRSRCKQLRGQPEARSTGGQKTDSSGWAGYAGQTVVNGGSKLLIFGPSQEGK